MKDDSRKKIIDNIGKVLDFPSESLISLEKALERGESLDEFNVQKITGMSGQKIEPLLMLLDEKNLDMETLQLILGSALATKKKIGIENSRPELTWTGPTQLDVNARDTSIVIKEMLKDAKKITLVIYSISEGADDIFEELSKCSPEKITIVIHDDKKMINKTILDNIFRIGEKPLILTRKIKGKYYYKVHAKVLIVNSYDMLLTSANLTFHGMSENFEMGIRIKGELAKNAEAMICKLKDSGYFEEY